MLQCKNCSHSAAFLLAMQFCACVVYLSISLYTMNPDPSNTIFQKAVAFVNQTNKHLFLTGKAGTGKTTFLKYIKENTFKRLAVVAPTGVAAINAGGVTIHSFFQLPLGPFIPSAGNYRGSYEGEMNNPATLLKNLRLNTAKRDVIRELDLLIIDEISMVRATCWMQLIP